MALIIKTERNKVHLNGCKHRIDKTLEERRKYNETVFPKTFTRLTKNETEKIDKTKI